MPGGRSQAAVASDRTRIRPYQDGYARPSGLVKSL